MKQNWMLVSALAPEGQTFILDDTAQWAALFAEHDVTCTVRTPIVATLTVLVQDAGCLFRGKLRGEITLPCDACTDEALVAINEQFDSFEAFPIDNNAEIADTTELWSDAMDETVLRQNPKGLGLEINLMALPWQELSLSLPARPLCTALCKGLCPQCGVNRNITACDCVTDRADSRFAVLRGLTIKK